MQPDILPDILYEDDDIRVVHRPGSSPYTLVTFADLEGRSAPGWFWGRRPVERLDLDAIGFVARRKSWYPAASVARCAALVQRAAKPERIGYGYSMGGYAALKHGRALGLARALAVAPQASIDPADVPDEPRFHHFFRPELHAGMRVGPADLPGWAAVLADPYDAEDRPHLNRLPQDPRLHRLVLPFTGHWAIWLVTGTDALRAALACVRAGDLAGLHRVLRAQRPGSAVWHQVAGSAALRHGHDGMAARLMQRAVTLGARPDGVRAMRALAMLTRAARIRRLGREEEAARLVQRVLADPPEDADMLDRLGHLLLPDDPERAETCFRAAVARDPAHANAHFGLSHALVAQNRREPAIREALHTRMLRPDDPQTLAWLGHLLLGKGDANGAEPYFREALALDGAVPHIYLGLSHVLGRQRRLSDAVALLREATARLPADPELAERLRRLQRQQSRTALRKLLRAGRRPVRRTPLPAAPQELTQAELLPMLRDLLHTTDTASRPNINALWNAVNGLDVVRLNLKFHGYQLARSLAAALPVRRDLSPQDVALACKPSTQADMESDWAAYWAGELGTPLVFHRKLWELAYVLQAVRQAGMLTPGCRALGFGCGTEAIPSYLAAQGVDVTVTDLAPEVGIELGWQDSRQHTASLDAAHHPHLVSRAAFDRHVRLEYVDMNAIPDHLRGYDVTWSICALEHLGTIARGLDFVRNSLDTLRSGGLAVHTTEFNFFRDDQTIDNWSTVLFQRRHFEALAARLRAEGHAVAPLDFDVGEKPMDQFIDMPPFQHQWSEQVRQSWRAPPLHMKVSIDGFPSTCFGLIIRKA